MIWGNSTTGGPSLRRKTARHWHGTTMTKNVGIHAASRSLGHTNIKTIMRYYHDAAVADNQDQHED